jgi:hypothetical protein
MNFNRTDYTRYIKPSVEALTLTLSDEALGVIPGRIASSADLGGSSKYSNENFED